MQILRCDLDLTFDQVETLIAQLFDLFRGEIGAQQNVIARCRLANGFLLPQFFGDLRRRLLGFHGADLNSLLVQNVALLL